MIDIYHMTIEDAIKVGFIVDPDVYQQQLAEMKKEDDCISIYCYNDDVDDVEE